MLSRLSPAAAVHVASLVVACVGFLILLAAGVPELQPFPPGVPVLLIAAAAVLAMPTRRWVPLVGVGLGIVIAIGAFFLYEGTATRLGNPAEFGLWSGTVLQMGGVIVAIIAGAAAVFGPRRLVAAPPRQG